jgi:hypothetical protein
VDQGRPATPGVSGPATADKMAVKGESLDADKAEKEPQVLGGPVDSQERTARRAGNFRLGMALQ